MQAGAAGPRAESPLRGGRVREDWPGGVWGGRSGPAGHIPAACKPAVVWAVVAVVLLMLLQARRQQPCGCWRSPGPGQGHAMEAGEVELFALGDVRLELPCPVGQPRSHGAA